jgi:integrase
MATVLTDRFLKSFRLPKGAKDKLVFDTQCPGLAARFTAAGNVRFLAQWTDKATGQKRREAIGAWGAIPLPKARELAQAILGKVAAGGDPVAERKRVKVEADAKQAEEQLTLEALISTWATLHLSKRSDRYSEEAQRALRYAFRKHLRKPAARLSRADVVSVLDALEQGGAATMAGRTASYGRAAYRWAVKRGTVPSNPFADLPTSAGNSERDRVLTLEELSDIWAAMGRMPSPWREFYHVALFTLQRREEVAGMRRAELSADIATWGIGAGRMKNNRQHVVHLSAPVRDVLQTIPLIAGSDLVFSTNGRVPVSGFSKAKRLLDAKIAEVRAERGESQLMASWWLHDLRRSGVTHLAEQGFDSVVVDRLLAHRPAKLRGVASVYQRAELLAQRKAALEAWAVYLTRSNAGADVLPFPTKSGVSTRE